MIITNFIVTNARMHLDWYNSVRSENSQCSLDRVSSVAFIIPSASSVSLFDTFRLSYVYFVYAVVTVE